MTITSNQIGQAKLGAELCRPADLEVSEKQLPANSLVEYFRCPPETCNFQLTGKLSTDAGYFRCGPDAICYGRSAAGSPGAGPDEQLTDVFGEAHTVGSTSFLPFDPGEIIENLRRERYVDNGPRQKTARAIQAKAVRNLYYFLRPILPVRVRKHIQKAYLKGWRDLTFPRWPVDATVDSVVERLMTLAIESRGGEPVPFVWFWPEGKSGCSVMTHDVETQLGVDLSDRLMDMNERYAVPASFQVIPEERYPISEAYLDRLRHRGFEVNIHDLNHDGHLFRERREFDRRIIKINQYAKKYGAVGFRAAVLYRNQDWFDRLDFEYDMSVPCVAHLDPQRGGCCTVMPYFVGNIVELPVTVIQDYSLFQILNEYSTQIWEQQISLILKRHGLINVIVHPDYITGPREEKVYSDLLGIFDRMRREQNLWVALPRDVARWWRQRSQMKLVEAAGEWRIEGAGSERALVAFARMENDKLVYHFGSPASQPSVFSSN